MPNSDSIKIYAATRHYAIWDAEDNSVIFLSCQPENESKTFKGLLYEASHRHTYGVQLELGDYDNPERRGELFIDPNDISTANKAFITIHIGGQYTYPDDSTHYAA